MNDDDWLEGLLKEQRLSSTPDDGFTDRLVARLPTRRPRPHRWIVPALSLLGAVLAAGLFRDSQVLDAQTTALAVADLSKTQLLETAAAEWQYQGFIIIALAAVGVSWIACAWALFATKADG
jgi:hypothetical protein